MHVARWELKRFFFAAGIVLMAGPLGHAALVWESTFDSDSDGVVNLREDNPHGATMIGTNAGGVLPINTQSLENQTRSNKAGRDTNDVLGHADSFGALYQFEWTFGGQLVPGPDSAGYFAGFTSSSSPHNTRQHIGARFIRQVDSGGSHTVILGGSWASEGFSYAGHNFANPVSLGTNLIGRPLHLAIGYDGSSKVLDVGLYEADTGVAISHSSGDIRSFDNLGFAPDSPQVSSELNALAVTHVGWTDFVDVAHVDTTWEMDSMRYYDDPISAFEDAVAPLRADGHWPGRGRYRFLVRVDPILLGGRISDERPAQLAIDLNAELQSQLGIRGIVNMNSVQIMRYDPDTQLAVQDASWAFGQSIADRAFRWYDNAIPYEYPEAEANISQTGGALIWVDRTRFGYFYDAEGDWGSGKLTWSHQQESGNPSYYAVYFDMLPAELEPWQASPRGFLGDGGMRTEPFGNSTTGAIHTRIDMTDWDGDGLTDIVAGNSRGGMAWYKNLGSDKSPRFGTSKILFTTDGNPMDVSWSSAPTIVDWDNDGAEDIISGGERNRMVWYKNVGTNSDRRFEYKGLIMIGGQPLALPESPNPDVPAITLDYYPVADVIDFDGDGDKDLIAGGFITGQLFLYENTGNLPDGTPDLKFQGAIEADGIPIDTQWSAAPTFADFNGDGLKDIVVGGMPMTAGGGDGTSSENFLRYYENVGGATHPVYEQRDMPIIGGAFPNSLLSTPRSVDFNNDGLYDLVVSAHRNIYLYENAGTETDPKFDAHSSPLPGEWGAVPLGTSQMIDWNGDGLLDRFSGLNVAINLGMGNPGIFGALNSILPPGEQINHLSGIGDDHQWQRLFDLDQNGSLDAMDADHDGKIWLHRNTGTTTEPSFDLTGVVLMRNDGNPIDVGPGPGDEPFDILQGSRATYAVEDFDKNGRADIVVANFNGILRYYSSDPLLADTIFELPEVIGDLGIRAVPFATDWDNDGWTDVIAQAHPDRFMFIRNLGVDGNGDIRFAPGVLVMLPPAPYGAGGDIVIADFNHDGDSDVLMQTAYGYTVFTDGSFLKEGYANAVLLGFEQLMELLGDANNDGLVSGGDLIAVQQYFGNTGPADGLLMGDANDDGVVSGLDLITVQQNFGTVLPGTILPIPEPGQAAIWILVAMVLMSRQTDHCHVVKPPSTTRL